jgi:hypothetical protein
LHGIGECRRAAGNENPPRQDGHRIYLATLASSVTGTFHKTMW